MDLKASADQKFFQETTRKFLESELPLTKVRELFDSEAGLDRAWWRKGAELGWTSLLVPEEHGGGSLSGAPIVDLIIVAEEFGRAVAPGPLGPTNIVAATLAASGSAQQQADVLPGLISGEQIGAWAMSEPGRAWDDVALAATASGSGYVLNGSKIMVEAGNVADVLLVTARAPEGLTQFLVPANASGVTITTRKSLDFTKRFADVEFANVNVDAGAVVGSVGGAADDVDRQMLTAVVLQCAEMTGAAQRVFEITLEWAGDRMSFGRPLHSYQALKHRFADMKMWLEASHGATLGAARALNDGEDEAAKTVSAAKAYIGDKIPDLMQDCVQMHGGIGVTWEHDLHLFVRRGTVGRGTYGTPVEHRERIAALVGL